ncbi:diacylglycerol/lipid kinase family protein [Haloglycomyces albus]|uniref:diacylglycerol/lipid kinase family protein n=1 Tax=Haloglycomyces albus TaxID=526067 RepID=UPI00046D61E2|nr:diacylglycerol kinase family protein [Haloglycomyces albus]
MRALLIVNPKATATSHRRLKRVVRALEEFVELRVLFTRARGHGEELAAKATQEAVDVILTLSGDGTLNEVINGMLAEARTAEEAPLLGPLPGGSTNVFARSLGLPTDPRRAVWAIGHRLDEKHHRHVSLGRVTDGPRSRLFTFTAGLGWDAAVIRRVESYRKRGKSSSPALYLRAIMAEINTHGTHGDSLRVSFADGEEDLSIGMVVVQNCAPWTYVGSIPINLNARASFNTGLDALLLRRLGMSTAAQTAARLLSGREVPDGKHSVTYHDLSSIKLQADQPQPFHLDGDYLGERRELILSSVPRALRVAA